MSTLRSAALLFFAVAASSHPARADSAPVLVTNDASAPVPVQVTNTASVQVDGAVAVQNSGGPLSVSLDAVQALLFTTQMADVTRFIVTTGTGSCAPYDGSLPGNGVGYYWTSDITAALPKPVAGQRLIIDEVSFSLQSFNLKETASAQVQVFASQYVAASLALPLNFAGNVDTPDTLSYGKIDEVKLWDAHLNTSFPFERGGSLRVVVRFAKPQNEAPAFPPRCDFTVAGHFATDPARR